MSNAIQTIEMITTPSQLLAMALDMGNMEFAKMIANSPEYTAEMETEAIAFQNRPKPEIDTTAADNAAMLAGRRDFEGMILRRQERSDYMMSM